jgi:hypothetical protein
VLVDGVSVGAVSSYTFHGVAADHTISATFDFTLIPTTVGIVANHKTVTHPHTVYFHGTVTPNRLTGTHVGFYVQKPGSHTWVRVTLRHISASHHWSYNYRLTVRGTYHFQARIGPTTVYAGSVSKTISVTAR